VRDAGLDGQNANQLIGTTAIAALNVYVFIR
jgi:hypothetical protein